MRYLVIGLLILSVIGCASQGRYTQRHDSHPEYVRADIDFTNVVPRYEPYRAATLRPYTVLGKHYVPLKTGKGYTATGEASWYGQKFHGHKTANGETYDMFKMSAAHKTLPLPSFVRVTNLENGRQAIVRVNDRGPFHSDRVIDLSYAAAMKLDIIKTGTGKVKLDIMHVDDQGILTVGNQPVVSPVEEANQSLFIQVAALQDSRRIEQLAKGLASLYQVPTHTPVENGVYRLRLGPLSDATQASQLLEDLKRGGYPGAYTLYAPH
ncbi:septal ring lytic transglycosylase RlpA family protein [Aestuariibacter halophilus]|uniref:Endolytic peptidoglycan transglycosylase RlpA n=1 Tax=Fluctibacter halophilus TaxID=226011 RepID=A0ABS8G5E4_9ALTE|nr:septal ring lytic transglycosylase RlpA family protein [Aestuariibacter halophilus]MCC2615817.1 septal ring lytic transglycosylase RlpA family protein [Aestuariibacter halophilus]